MDRRTKILAIGFGAVIAYLLIAQVVYPNWIRPMLTIDQRVAERRAELEKLENMQKALDAAKEEYRDYVARIGTFDAGRVETAIRDRLNALIEKHKLENASVAPSRPVEDRKTGLTTSVITVTAVGSLESAVNFLKDVAELPELARIGNPAIYPAGSNRKGADKDQVNVRLPIEVLVLPKHKIVGPIDPATLPKSESFVRHAGRDYADIWDRKPFTEYVELPPLRVDAQKIVNAEVGQQAFLHATASGGDGNYTFAWMPTDGLSEPTTARTSIDTSAIRTQTYTVTVTDTVKDRQPVTATVAVSIREPKPAPTKESPPPPPPEKVADRDHESRNKQIVMTLLRSAGTTRTNELMVTNSRTKETTYHKVTEDFDGGKLVYVHQTGGIVHRMGQYFVYPLGAGLDNHMEYQQAAEYPELKAAAERAVALETARARAQPKNAPVGEAPTDEQRTLDSRGGDGVAAGTSANPTVLAAPVEGPIFPVPVSGSDSQEGALVGPPDQAPQTQTMQNPAAQPAAKTQNPNQPSRPANTRPRPTKDKGRL